MPTAAVMVMRPPWLSGVMTVLGGIGVWDMALAIGFRATSAAGLKSRERDQERAEDDR